MGLIRKHKVGTVQRIFDKIRYGLVFQVLRNKLYRFGIEITPFYLTQLGVNVPEEPQPKDKHLDFTCEFLNENDLIGMKASVRGYTGERLLNNLKSGKKCYGLKIQDRIAAFMWIDLKECNFKPYRFPLQKNEAYTFSVYTMEEYRGQSLAAVMAFNCYKELKLLGINKIYSITEYFNRSAAKYKMKLGPKKIKLFLFIGMFNRYKKLFLLRKYS